MAFYARKSFVYEGHQYVPGDEVGGFPTRFPRGEAFIRAGIIVEREEPPAPPQTKRVVTRKRKMTEVVPLEAAEV
jgi:hypothetical protein